MAYETLVTWSNAIVLMACFAGGFVVGCIGVGLLVDLFR